MRFYLILAMSFYLCYCSGGAFTYPSIKAEGNSLNNFLPEGWKIIDSAKGDLNRDGIQDASLIIESKDSVKIHEPGYYKDTMVFEKARILIILLKDSKSKHYKLSGYNNELILRKGQLGDPGDPLVSFYIKKGVLDIYFSTDGLDKLELEYKFRFRENKWMLIGVESNQFFHLFCSVTKVSYNFLTMKSFTISGNCVAQDGYKETYEWEIIEPRIIIRLDELKEAFTNEPFPF